MADREHTLMAFYACPSCEQLFHEPNPKEYVWCSCGQPLCDADIAPGPSPLAEPGLAPPTEGEMDQFDRRAMVGAVYSPCFLRAIVKRQLTELSDGSLMFEVAVSDGQAFAAIAVQIAASDGEG